MHKPGDESTAKEHSAFITQSMHIVVPTIRMVCVWAMWEDDELRSGVSAVVALETHRAACYKASGPNRPAQAPDHAGMVALGWTYDEQAVFRDAQIVDPENDSYIMTAGEVFTGGGSHYKLVVADWPRAQDDERLQETLEDVRRAASADGPPDDDDD
jgi:hypothetical protein